MKVQAVACDRVSCDSVAKAGENGLPTGWYAAMVTQSGRKIIDGVFCSMGCVSAFMRDTGEPQRRKRRTRAEIQADEEAAAAAANGETTEEVAEV